MPSISPSGRGILLEGGHPSGNRPADATASAEELPQLAPPVHETGCELNPMQRAVDCQRCASDSLPLCEEGWSSSWGLGRASPELWRRSVVGMVTASGRRQRAHLHDRLGVPRPGEHRRCRRLREVPAADEPFVVLLNQEAPGEAQKSGVVGVDADDAAASSRATLGTVLSPREAPGLRSGHRAAVVTRASPLTLSPSAGPAAGATRGVSSPPARQCATTARLSGRHLPRGARRSQGVSHAPGPGGITRYLSRRTLEVRPMGKHPRQTTWAGRR